MPGIAIAVVVGLIFAILVNMLADVLPKYRMQESDDENAIDSGAEAGESIVASVQSEPAGRWHWSPDSLLSVRSLVVALLIVAASIYLWNREASGGLVFVYVFYIAL